MSILDRYLIKNFSQSFIYSSLAFLLIFFISALVGQIEVFLRYQATAAQITLYFLNQVPFLFTQAAPLATLLAALFTLGGMSGRNEITVLKASGVSLMRLAFPLWLAAVFLSLFIIILNELLVPQTSLRSRQILNNEIIDKKTPGFTSRNNIVYRGENRNIYYIELLEKETLRQVTVLQYGPKNDLITRIDAQKAVYIKDKWHFLAGVERRFEEGGSRLLESKSFSEKIMSLKETPEDFRSQQRLPHELTYRELKVAVEREKAGGGDYRQDLVFLYFKISFPFAAFFMSYLAIPFAFFKSRSNPIINFATALIIALIYWYSVAVSHTLGVSGLLTPFLAAWAANIIFSLLGIYFYLYVPH